MLLNDIDYSCRTNGLRVRGFCPVGAGERLPSPANGKLKYTIVLIGNTGPDMWPMFRESPEHHDGDPNPLDRWSRRIGDHMAQQFGGYALYPFETTPPHPFLRWARRAENLSPSPLGIMMHPQYGLWHAYRFALLFERTIEPSGPMTIDSHSPCITCEERACLHSCPAEAFSDHDYRVDACVDHLRETPQASCHSQGCVARLACPVAAGFRYEPEQHVFHLRAFLAARAG